MKKLLLLAITSTLSFGVWADASCKSKPHAPIPPKNLSLYNKQTNNLDDYSTVRNNLIKQGWFPVPSDDKYAEYPEEECISDRCIFTYKDKYKNTLWIEKPDDISRVTVKCS